MKNRAVRTKGTGSGRLARRILAVFLVAALCAVFVPLVAQVSLASGTTDLRDYLSTPQAVSGDGGHPLGLKLSPPGNYAQTPTAPALMYGMPLGASADISSQMPPVGNQGQQGSCVAWATSYYYKSWSEKQDHGWSLTDTKHQFSPSFVYNQINGGGDNGSSFYSALSLLQNTGDVDIAEFPYNQNNYTNQPTAAQLQAARPYRIPSGWTSFFNRGDDGPYSPPNDISNVKAWIAGSKPVVMGIPIFKDWPDDYGNPNKSYYVYNGTSAFAGGHGVCIVGYDDNINPGGADADHKGGFKMINSWGASWNGNGYVWLSYDFVKRYIWEAWTMGDLEPDTPSVNFLSKTSANVGDSVEINGTNFGTQRRQAKVTFNGTAATQVTWTNEKVTAVVPAGATSGPVAVFDWEGTSSNTVALTVGGGSAALSVTSVDPSEGNNSGSLAVTVDGTGFVSGCGVKLSRSGSSDIQGTGLTNVSGSELTCSFDLTAAAAGAWDVVVTNPDAGSARLVGGFTVKEPNTGGDTYEPNDTFGAAYGPLQSGNAYASYIWSSGDSDYYRITAPVGCGTLAATLTTIPSGCDYDLYVYDSAQNEVGYSANGGNIDEEALIDRPAAGTYYLVVEPYDGGSSQTDPYHIGFSVTLVPAVSGVSPNSGKKQTRLTISGANFGATRGSSYVSFGSVKLASSDYYSWSDTSISCRVPAGASGKPMVKVTTASGTSNGVYFYVVPIISTINPTSGRPGSIVTITGQSFGSWVSGQTLVYFGSTRGVQYTGWNNGTIKVKVPSVSRGSVTLKVRTPGGTSAAKTFTVR
jgi:hypothetical protein